MASRASARRSLCSTTEMRPSLSSRRLSASRWWRRRLGDEILFVIDDPASAAEATLQLLDMFTADGALPQVHAGLAFGPVLDRGGDVFGPVVNVAARFANIARKGTIRVDQAMANELADAKQFTLSVRAPRRVRGYLQLPSYRLRRSHKP